MDTELLPLLTGAMSACPPVRSLSACAAGCGPSALAALKVEIHLSSALIHFVINILFTPGQRPEGVQECVG